MTEPLTYFVQFSDGRQYGPADMPTLLQWARDGRLPADALLIERLTRNTTPAVEHPELRPIITAPPMMQRQPTPDQPDAVSTIIPYRNPPALIGYYISIFSLIPFVGVLLGPTAIILGVVGLRKRKADPNMKGSAHAWVAIVLGLIGTLISVGCIVPGMLAGFAGP